MMPSPGFRFLSCLLFSEGFREASGRDGLTSRFENLVWPFDLRKSKKQYADVVFVEVQSDAIVPLTQNFICIFPREEASKGLSGHERKYHGWRLDCPKIYSWKLDGNNRVFARKKRNPSPAESKSRKKLGCTVQKESLHQDLITSSAVVWYLIQTKLSKDVAISSKAIQKNLQISTDRIMKFSTAAFVLAVASSTTEAFQPTATTRTLASSSALFSTTEQQGMSKKKENRLNFMKSDRFHRRGFKEVRDKVEANVQQQYQSELVDDLKSSNYLIEKDGVKIYLAKVSPTVEIGEGG